MKFSMRILRNYLVKKLLLRHKIGSKGNIGIVSIKNGNSEIFLEVILRSLGLIQLCEKTMYNRMQRNILWIVDTPEMRGNHSGYYISYNRSIVVDFEFELNARGYQWHIVHYASLLVFYSTFANIRLKGLKGSEDNANRVAYICLSKVNKFLKDIPPNISEMAKYSPWQLDEAYLENHFTLSRPQKFILWVGRLKKEFRKDHCSSQSK